MNRKQIGVLSLCLLCGCGGDSRAALMKEQFDILNEAGEVLASVKDVESARQAQPKLRDFGVRMQALEKREKSLPQLTPADGKRLRAQYKDRAADIGRFVHEVIRLELAGPAEVKKTIQEELDLLRLNSPQLQEFMKGQKGPGAEFQ